MKYMLFYLQAIVILIGSQCCVGASPYSQYIDLQERALAADLRLTDIDTVKYIFTEEVSRKFLYLNKKYLNIFVSKIYECYSSWGHQGQKNVLNFLLQSGQVYL